MQDLTFIDSKNPKIRIILVGAIVLVLAFGFLGVKWQIANLLAGITRPADPNATQISDVALNWSSSDPAANWLKASTSDEVSYFEQTVRLAPGDYRWRIELGRALEQDGQTERAEVEFKKAAELAPSFAFPRWHLGNFYLRQDRGEEAMAELKRAADNNQAYREQVFSLAWDYFDKDASQVEKLVGERAQARSQIALFFAARGRADDALRNWNMLNESDKAANSQFLKIMAQGVFEQRHFPQALAFEKQLGIDQDAQPEAVTNSSFEKVVDDSTGSRFAWQIVRNVAKFETATDANVKHEGNRSLRVTFKSFNKPVLGNIYQAIVVVPGNKYRLSFWVRTENLKSAGGPVLDIVNANDDKLIAKSAVFPTGSNDWQEMTVEFEAPANCSGISIRTARAYCGEDCPIIGTFWYDDFQLNKR